MVMPKYEVFISHPGCDKRDFVSILHYLLNDALHAAHMSSFMDELDLMKRNATAEAQMLEAARHASIGVTALLLFLQFSTLNPKVLACC